MFSRILVANRSEIAVRVIRACRDMGIVSVAVYSEADRDALHAQIADEAVCIGPAQVKESYLNENAVLSAAKLMDADAIHPGYGFFAENAGFARRCRELGIGFIGPSPESIEMLGDKARARELARSAGVPVTPGTDVLDTLEAARAAAREIGYPLLIKAVAGGGGKGIRLVENESELERAYNAARNEVGAYFGNDAVYIEKFLKSPRHIEIQILADRFGNTVHLLERDCSIQRRRQKVIEESPSPFLTADLRERMGDAAVRVARAAGYENAGTIEFLVDSAGNYYFMEMNTRIQVEHPVTEEVTGLDLVRRQIEIAAGMKLDFTQSDVRQQCCAIECRVNAEDPMRGFAPSPGLIASMHVPGGPGVRVDSAMYQGCLIPPFYDSMIAKLIVRGKDRETTLDRMRRALSECLIEGIITNADFLMEILREPDFNEGDYAIDYFDKHDFSTMK